MFELSQQRNEINKELNTALSLLKSRGSEYAEAEKAYRSRLRVEILAERDKGTPVTIISDICRGHEEIAKLKQERDVAKTLYESAKEAINIKKIQLKIIETDIEAIRNSK